MPVTSLESDQHRGGEPHTTVLSVYYSNMGEAASPEDTARFLRLAGRELPRHLVVSVSPAALPDQHEQSGRLRFSRLVWLKSALSRNPPAQPAQLPVWARSVVEAHLYKCSERFSRQPSGVEASSASSERDSGHRFRYYQTDYFRLDVLECDADSRLSNSDSVAFRAADGDGYQYERCSRVVTLLQRAAFDVVQANSSHSTGHSAVHAAAALLALCEAASGPPRRRRPGQ